MFTIPAHELEFRVSRAGGPGGQHVNKASTRAEVRWNVLTTTALTSIERERVLRKLANRIGADGVMRVVADDRRSLLRNRMAATERLLHLVDTARRAPKPRRPTRPPASSKRARLDSKRKRSTRKRERSRPDLDE